MIFFNWNLVGRGGEKTINFLIKAVDADSSGVFGIFLSVISLVVLLGGSWSPPFKSSRRLLTT